MATPEETKLLDELQKTWPKHWPSLDDLRGGNPEIAVLILAGRQWQTEKDIIEIAKIVAKSGDPKTAERIGKYFEKRDKQLQETVA